MSSENEVNDVNESTESVNGVNKNGFTSLIRKHLSDILFILLIIIGSIVVYMVI